MAKSKHDTRILNAIASPLPGSDQPKEIYLAIFAIFYLACYSRPELFRKKGVLRKFAKFTGKYLCQNLFYNKVAGLRPTTLSKKRPWHRCFPVKFVKFLRTPFLTEHPRWLLL